MNLSVQGVTLVGMSTDDQIRASALTGEALKAARDEVPQEILDRLGAAAEGNDRLRVQTAGEMAVGRGEDLIAAALLLLSGPVDGDSLSMPYAPGTSAARAACRGTTRAADLAKFCRVRPNLGMIGSE